MAMLMRRVAAGLAKHKPMDAFKTFLQHDAGSSIRQQPHHKDRKYAHVEIAEQFKRHQQNRKKQRVQHLKARKELLQQKLSTQSKLLTSEQGEELGRQMRSLKEMLEEQSRDLAALQEKLEGSESELVMMEGPRKLIVLNKIEYLKHMNYHPSGLVLNPETVAVIQNVHYLVNNNLPVNKYKLYELMPQIFITEIKELEESMQKLIKQKQLDPVSDPSSRIRFFVRHKTRFVDPEQDIIDLQDERNEVFSNFQQEIVRLMEPHMNYVRMVDKGLTPFRNSLHLITVMLSNTLNLNFTPQQLALRKTIRDAMDLRKKFQIYNDEVNKKVIQMRYRYVQPPVYVKNHPVLMERYEKLMVKYTNPEEVSSTMGLEDTPDDGGRAYLQEKIKQIVIDKLHPIIEQLWNSGKREELIATKKKLEIDFYNESTKVLEEYNEMLAERKEKDEFLKIPKRPREIAEQKYALVGLDELTKTIFVNNANPAKYGLAFFTKFLGLESEEDARKLFNSFSYMRVPPQQGKSIQSLQFEIIKFKAP